MRLSSRLRQQVPSSRLRGRRASLPSPSSHSAALDIQSERKAEGALKPWEIREAVRRLKQQERRESPEYKHRRLFKR